VITTSIHDYELLKRLRTSNLVRIFFNKKNTAVFYLSDKQYLKLVDSFERAFSSKLKNAFVIAVFDNSEERFVWCGVEYPDYSDRQFLINNFNAEWCNNYSIDNTPTISHHTPDKIKINNVKPIKELKR